MMLQILLFPIFLFHGHLTHLTHRYFLLQCWSSASAFVLSIMALSAGVSTSTGGFVAGLSPSTLSNASRNLHLFLPLPVLILNTTFSFYTLSRYWSAVVLCPATANHLAIL